MKIKKYNLNSGCKDKLREYKQILIDQTDTKFSTFLNPNAEVKFVIPIPILVEMVNIQLYEIYTHARNIALHCCGKRTSDATSFVTFVQRYRFCEFKNGLKTNFIASTHHCRILRDKQIIDSNIYTIIRYLFGKGDQLASACLNRPPHSLIACLSDR